MATAKKRKRTSLATARFEEERHYIVLLGDVGTGKSTLVEKISGETGISSSQSTSCTKVSLIYESFDKQILICDTPGSNAMADKFKHNAWIATAINYSSVSRILICVLAQPRIANVIDVVKKYLEGFLDLPEMENVVGVCITHMDQVDWTENEFRMSLDGELGIRSVVFSSMKTSGGSLVKSILEICVGRHDLSITAANFLKVFNIANSNVKILRSVKREIDDFKDIRRFFKEQMAILDDQDRIDAIFEFQAWMEEMIIQAQMRVSEQNGFSFEGTNMMNEAGHIANMTNQLRAILFDIRTEILGCQQKHGATDLRECPHCGLIWTKISGCEGQTLCGNRMDSCDGRNVFATFSFSWSSEIRSLKISRSGKKKALQNLGNNSSRGIGCGNTICWNRMKPVDLPQEALKAVNVTVDDIQLVPETIADRGWMDTISSVLQRFGNSIVFNGIKRRLGLLPPPSK